MDTAYISGLSALAGSAIGALSTFATTWLTQHRQEAAQRRDRESTRRERLFGDFIDEASHLMGEALVNKLEDPGKLSRLYAAMNKLRLFASDDVLESGDKVLATIVATFNSEATNFWSENRVAPNDVDVLRDFARQCREDLRSF